jgi:hypothetical protein
MSPSTTGLLVTMSQLLVALLPTAREKPVGEKGCSGRDDHRSREQQCFSNAFMASLPRAG